MEVNNRGKSSQYLALKFLVGGVLAIAQPLVSEAQQNEVASYVKGASSSNSKSMDMHAQEQSKGGKSIGFLIIKGKKDAKISDQVMIDYFMDRVFAANNVKAKVFVEKGQGTNTIYELYINGTSSGLMNKVELKARLPKLISTQKGFDARRY